MSVEDLRKFLSSIPEGGVPELHRKELERLVANGWYDLDGPDEGMAPYKLHNRMEEPTWRPPLLTFTIERHGGTVMGSSRAELQRWELNVETQICTCSTGGYRQLKPMNAPLRQKEVETLADRLAEAILCGDRADTALRWLKNGKVRVSTGALVGGDRLPNQTLQGRRSRLSKALQSRLAPHGWHSENGNYSLRSSPDVRLEDTAAAGCRLPLRSAEA